MAKIVCAVAIIVSWVERIECASRSFLKTVRSGAGVEAVGVSVGNLHCDSSRGLPNKTNLKRVVTGPSPRYVFVHRAVKVVHSWQHRQHGSKYSSIRRVSAKIAPGQIGTRRIARSAGCHSHRLRIDRRRLRTVVLAGLPARAFKSYRSAGDRRIHVALREEMNAAGTNVSDCQDRAAAEISLDV